MGLLEKVGKKLFLRWLKGKEKGWRMGKAWQFLSGWKLLLGAVSYMGVLVWDQLSNGHAADFAGSILAVLGFDPAAAGVDFPKAAASLVAVIGVGHKVWKAQRQARAGARASELLAGPGYVRDLTKNPQDRT